MEKYVKRITSGYATGRKVMVFTHDRAGPDGKPAIAYSPALEHWWWLDGQSHDSKADQGLQQEVSSFLMNNDRAVIVRLMEAVSC